LLMSQISLSGLIDTFTNYNDSSRVSSRPSSHFQPSSVGPGGRFAVL